MAKEGYVIQEKTFNDEWQDAKAASSFIFKDESTAERYAESLQEKSGAGWQFRVVKAKINV